MSDENVNAIEETTEQVSTDVEDRDVKNIDITNETTNTDESYIDDVNDKVDFERGNWYIIQTLSNKENRVQTRIQSLIEEGKYKSSLYQVLVPTQQTIEIKNNKRIEKSTKIFPGYVFVQMEQDSDLAFEIRQLEGVSKFIGGMTDHKPTPIAEDEVLRVLRKAGATTKEVDVDFEVGEVIKVISGPFRGYSGTISEINATKGKMKAKISIFGRETPVELDFEQAEKTI